MYTSRMRDKPAGSLSYDRLLDSPASVPRLHPQAQSASRRQLLIVSIHVCFTRLSKITKPPWYCSYMESLTTSRGFPSRGPQDGEAGEGVEKETDPEETLVWTLFLRSQLEERTGFLQEAYDTLEVRRYLDAQDVRASYVMGRERRRGRIHPGDGCHCCTSCL